MVRVGPLVGILFLGSVTFAAAQTTPPATSASFPRVIRISGTLPMPAGVPSSPQAVTFAIYTDETGGTPLWQETQTVIVDRTGAYSALLGSTMPDGLPLEMFTTKDARWLSIHVERPNEPDQPRVLIASVPYALRAADADTLAGRPASAYVLADPPPGAARTADGTTSTASSTTSSPTTTNTRSMTATVGTPGHLAQFVDASNLGDSVVAQVGARIGVGTVSPADYLHIAFNDPYGAFTGLAVQNLSSTANAASGMLFFDQNGALAQFQGFTNATHEYRINNIASGGSINFLVGSSSKFLVANSGNIGIGNTTPAFKLDVAGDINTTGALKIGGNATLATSITGATTPIGSTCTNYFAGSVTLNTVPGHTIEVVGTVTLKLNHVNGTKDYGYVVVGTTPTDCGGAGAYYWAAFSLSASDATDASFFVNVPFRAIFQAGGSPATVTYYLNAIMSSGQDAGDTFWYGNMTAHMY
jgi:hypothetical protein